VGNRAGLTPRELEILRMAARGLTDKEIAARLSTRSHTVSNYLTVILLKLGARNRTEAVAQAVSTGHPARR
jgi:DNA-binding CsgD family transcriptional regulator